MLESIDDVRATDRRARYENRVVYRGGWGWKEGDPITLECVQSGTRFLYNGMSLVM